MKKFLFYSLFALTLLAVPSCGSDKEDEPQPSTIAVSGLTLDNTSIIVLEGETITLTATVTPDNATDKTVSWTTSDAAVATVSDGKVSAVKEGEAIISAKAGNKTAECKVTVSALLVNKFVAKSFSVSETKQVYFSSGNLQYHCKNKEWRFAQLQYDYIREEDNLNISDDYDGYIDLFGWGTGGNPTLASTNNDDYATFSDWGAMIDGDVWHTLTVDEWGYLFDCRENASEKYGVAEVAGVCGLILLPDGWSLPDGLSFNSGMADKTGWIYFSKNNYSAADWRKMESSGAVFLPAANFRYGKEPNPWGGNLYWSSTAEGTDEARCLRFDSSFLTWGQYYSMSRCIGCAVRLVRYLQ